MVRGLVPTAIILATLLAIVPAFAQTGSIQILDKTSFIDQVGFLHIIADVKNTSGDTKKFVQATVTFYDSTKTVVGTAFSFTTISVLRNNERSPVEVIWTDTSQIPKVDSYKLDVDSGLSVSALSPQLDLKPGTGNLDSNIGYYHAVGEVTNNGAVTTHFVEVAGSFFDSNNKLVATAFTFTNPKDLAPDQTAPFELIVTVPAASTISTFRLNTESQEYAMIDPSLEETTTSPPPKPNPIPMSPSQTELNVTDGSVPEFPFPLIALIAGISIIIFMARHRLSSIYERRP